MESIRGARESLIGTRLNTSLRRPINRIGSTTKRWARWTAKCRDAVLARNMRLRFGLCDVPDCKNRYQDLAHLFGRAGTGARLGEPWCSLPELCLALCRQHHNLIDRGLGGELLSRLRITALANLAIRFGRELEIDTGEYYSFGFKGWNTTYHDPIDAARRAVDELSASWDFDMDSLKFTRKEA